MKEKIMTIKTNKMILLAVIVITASLVVGYFYQKNIFNTSNNSGNVEQVIATENLPSFTVEELSQYDGTDVSKPIYIGMDGLVYDVTPGKKFYEVGGAYHYLAGRDSSEELHQAGGAIIKRKYNVVGTIAK